MTNRCASRLLRWGAILLMIAMGSDVAAACSLRPPWEIEDPRLIAFIGSPLPDTVRAGAGSMHPVEEMGHFGGGAPRVAYGQRVRLDRLGDLARRALPRGAREVVLVPWDYATDCRPVVWQRSARWLSDGLNGLFRARLRAPADWAEGIPTFDIVGPQLQPYRELLPGATVVDAVFNRMFSREPRLSAPELLALYDSLPPMGAEPDTVAALRWLIQTRADTALMRRYPVNRFWSSARRQFAYARAKAVRVPVAGTFRLDVTFDTLPPRTLFLRLDATVSSLQDSMRGVLDTALVPRLPEGYYVNAEAATTLEQLATNCVDRTSSAFAYVDLDWHPPMPADGTGEWKGGIDARLLEVLLSRDERERWQVRRRAASAAAAESMQALPDSVRAIRLSQPFIFIPDRPLRIRQNATGPMRIDGVMTIPLLGRFQVRGERISRAPFVCPR